MQEKINKILFLSAAIFLLALSALLPVEKHAERLTASVAESALPPLATPTTLAKSTFVMDLETGAIIFKKNSGEILPLASLTKIISSLVILDKLNLEDEIIISQHAILTKGFSQLKAGEHFKVKDLLAMVMVESSNDSLEALVENLAAKNDITKDSSDSWFLILMNDKATSLGAKTMMFYNPTGLDLSKEAAGAFGSAEDLMAVLKNSLDSELWQFGNISEVISKEGIVHKLKPTNLLAGELNGLIGAKTGSTDLAGGNLLVIVEYQLFHPIGIVVLGSTDEGRFEDVKKILEWVKTN